MELLELYKLQESLENENNLNGGFIKAVMEQVEYMENYQLSMWKALGNCPIKAYMLADQQGEMFKLFMVDYSGRYADYPLRLEDKILYIRVSKLDTSWKYTELQIQVKNLFNGTVNIIPLSCEQYKEKYHEMCKRERFDNGL